MKNILLIIPLLSFTILVVAQSPKIAEQKIADKHLLQEINDYIAECKSLIPKSYRNRFLISVSRRETKDSIFFKIKALTGLSEVEAFKPIGYFLINDLAVIFNDQISDILSHNQDLEHFIKYTYLLKPAVNAATNKNDSILVPVNGVLKKAALSDFEILRINQIGAVPPFSTWLVFFRDGIVINRKIITSKERTQ